MVSRIHTVLLSDPSRKKDFSFPVSIGIYISRQNVIALLGAMLVSGALGTLVGEVGVRGQPVPGRWW